MALVREPTPRFSRDDEFIVDPEVPFLVANAADSGTYDVYLHHPWELELPCGVLGAEPGNANGNWTNAPGFSSSSSSSSPVTFDGHGEEYFYGAMAPSHAASSAVSNLLFSFESGSRTDAMPSTNKRPCAAHVPPQHGAQEEAATVAKKPCGGKRFATKRTKAPTATPPREPQTTAAKNRRERVNERLKVLQDMVPNGRKVDTVTMLDKAITYVKFMKLQLKVLETDAFWPTQGGKAPDMSQVKEALGDILLSVSSSSQCNH